MPLKGCICASMPRPERDGNGRYVSLKCECGRATIYCKSIEEAEAIWNENGNCT